MRINSIIAFLASAFFISSCGVQSSWVKKGVQQSVVNDSPVHSVYLLGDGGKSKADNPVLALLQAHLRSNNLPDSSETILFLGDNIYQFGLPDTTDKLREQSVSRLNAQLKAVKKHKGLKIMLPGNHDWNRSKKGGLAQVKREQQYVEHYLNDINAFQPKNGCPGPVEFVLNDNLILLTVDSEWWLHKHEKPEGESSPCNSKSKTEFIHNIVSVVKENPTKKVLIAMHHPLYTNGGHGGCFPIQDHIFPLRVLNDALYIPLPVIGSIYPVTRQIGLYRQDLPNKHYKGFRKELEKALKPYSNVVFAGGHEHSLQLHKKDGFYQIVSGTASKTSHVLRGKTALFVSPKMGFCVLDVYQNGKTSVRFVSLSDQDNMGEVLFEKYLD